MGPRTVKDGWIVRDRKRLQRAKKNPRTPTIVDSTKENATPKDPKWNGAGVDISLDVEALEDCFVTGAAGNHNSNKRRPFVDMQNLERESARTNKRHMAESECDDRSFPEHQSYLMGQSMEEEAEEEEEEEEKECDFEARVAVAVDQKLGEDLQDYITKKCVKSLRDPINKKVAGTLDAFKEDVLPKVAAVKNIAVSNEQALSALQKDVTIMAMQLVKIKLEASQQANFLSKKLGQVEAHVAALNKALASAP